MDFSTIATLAFSTGLVTALLNQGISWWRDARKEKDSSEKDARYLAIRLAVILETFAVDCAELIAAYSLFHQTGGGAGAVAGTLPNLAPYPDENDWKALKPDFLARCLSFRNELKIGDSKIGFWEDVGFRESVPDECKQQAGKYGYLAWLLAREMRLDYQLGEIDPKSLSWNVLEALKPVHDEVIANKAGMNLKIGAQDKSKP